MVLFVCFQWARTWIPTGLPSKPTLLTFQHSGGWWTHPAPLSPAVTSCPFLTRHLKSKLCHAWPNKWAKPWKHRQAGSSGKAPPCLFPAARKEQRNKYILNFILHCGPVPTVSRITQADENSLTGDTKGLQVTHKWQQRPSAQAWWMEALGECTLCRPWQHSPGPFILPDPGFLLPSGGKCASNPEHSYMGHILFPWLWLPWDYSLKRK